MKYQAILEHPTRLRAMTGLTSDEFLALLPFFHETLENHLRVYTIDGYRREGRRYVVYSNAPLPTSEDKLLFILTYMKNNAIQEIQGQLFHMSQSNVSKWTQLLHMILNLALEQQHFLPERNAEMLAARLCAEPSTEMAPSPPFFTMEPSVQ